MICPRCHGTGKVTRERRVAIVRQTFQWEEICPDCLGSGRQHCCDGEREQPAPTYQGGMEVSDDD